MKIFLFQAHSVIQLFLLHVLGIVTEIWVPCNSKHVFLAHMFTVDWDREAICLWYFILESRGREVSIFIVFFSWQRQVYKKAAKLHRQYICAHSTLANISMVKHHIAKPGVKGRRSILYMLWDHQLAILVTMSHFPPTHFKAMSPTFDLMLSLHLKTLLFLDSIFSLHSP